MGGLTVTVPKGAHCGLYPQTPGSVNWFEGLDPHNAIAPTRVTARAETETYFYANPESGVYHFTAALEGFYSLCQMLLYTPEKAGMQLNLELEPMAGNGYEAGHVMRSTREFAQAQKLSRKDAWGPQYAKLFRTPQFLRDQNRPGRHQQTTNEELYAFIAGLAETNKSMHVYSLGKTPKYGYDMLLVLFTRENVAGLTLEQAARRVRSNGKPTVQYIAQCHSTEPASAEGALAMMGQLCGDYGRRVLDKADVYIIPRINPDGAFEVRRCSPTTGEDMNRDYLYMHNQEIRMVVGAYNLFLPEVCIDGHEKRDVCHLAGDSLCTDMELQVGAGALNHPQGMTQKAMEMALLAMEKAKSLGLRSHFYAKLASAAGGSAGSSYFGTRNSLSFLVETPGQTHLGMAFMERRVLGQYVLASTVIDYTVEHAREVMELVRTSREEMVKSGAVYDEKKLIVLRHEKTETGIWSSPLIHVPSGRVTDPNHAVAYNEQTKALHSRPRATAYVIPKGLPNEAEILRVTENHAISRYELPAGSQLLLRQYTWAGEQADLEEERLVSFPEGAYVFPNTVPSTVLGVIMEPDFNRRSGRKMTLYSMGLMDADETHRLPLYRHCHDLQDGRI